jgi:hypothetical protein
VENADRRFGRPKMATAGTLATGSVMTDPKGDLAQRSARILDAIDDLRALEKDKRTETISTPPFHRLAEAVTKKSREIFEMAYRQEAVGDRTDTTDESIEQVEGRKRR